MMNDAVRFDVKDLQAEHLGLPAWAWPTLGLAAGFTLLLLVHGFCFLDPTCK